MSEQECNVLLVEDNMAHAALIIRAFENSASYWRLQHAKTLKEAKSMLAQQQPDLMLLDNRLPDGEGKELLPGTVEARIFPIIMMTAYGDEKMAVNALKSGALDYVVKSDLMLAEMPRLSQRVWREWEHITETRQMADALRVSEERFRKSTLNAPYPIMIHAEGDVIELSKVWTDITGYRLDEMSSIKKWTKLAYGDEAELSIEFINNLYNLEGLQYDGEWTVKIKDGTTRLWDFSSSSLGKLPDGRRAIISMAVDITERRHLEEQLQTHQHMDSIGTLVGGIAHDFNNILAALKGNIELLSMHTENFNEKQKRFLKNSTKSTDRAVELIGQLQTLSTVSSSNIRTIDIHEIAEDVFTLLNETTDRLIRKEVKFNKGEFLISANSGELHQVLLNLATNSAHSIEEREATSSDYIQLIAENYQVRASDRTGLIEGDYVHLSFEDTGAGMSDDVLKKAFDPLFTTKAKSSKRGQGLGLAMVYNIITRHNHGHIDICSKQGKGTTFHIYLPKAQPEMSANSKEVVAEKGGTETILVVDDDEMVANMVQEMLMNIGYTVLIANDGMEALKIYTQKMDLISAVLLDLNMPKMSGKQVFQEILKINPEVRVIISSGYGVDHSQQGILAQAKGNLSKPYTLEDLSRVVRKVLNS